MRRLRYLLPGLLLLLAVACGSDAETAPTVTSVPPTSTPYVSPTFTPVVDLSSLVVRELLGLERLREFPEELKSDSPPLDREEAAEIARVFLSNTRVAGAIHLDEYCSDGFGQVLFVGKNDFDGALFQWEVLPDPAGRWNRPRVVLSILDPDLTAFLEAIGEGDTVWILDEEVISKDDPSEVYDHPTCGQSLRLH